MGILKQPLQFVRDLKLKRGYTVCELGDQWITHTERRLSKDWHQENGCSVYVSIDGNGRGTHTFDLNRPIKGLEPSRFDLVTDFGTGEHVFNQAQVFATLHYLTKTGGYLVFDRPSQGYQEHCYFNMHMCVIEDFAAANKYRIVTLTRALGRGGGELIRGVLQKVEHQKFVTPQQGRYKKLLRPITGEKAAS